LFAFDHVVGVFRRARTKRRNLLRGRRSRLRLRTRDCGYKNGTMRRMRRIMSAPQNPTGRSAGSPYRVFSKISRPISMRLISLVPAPIS